jgi:chromosome segregation ATPase
MVRGIMKKGLIGVGIGAAALFALYGTKAWYYACHYAGKARDTARAAVPFEAEVDAARQQVKALDPAIEQGIETVAGLEQSIGQVKAQIVALREELDHTGRQIKSLRAQLPAGGVQRVSSGSEAQARRAKVSLSRALDSYQRAQSILEVKQSELEHRQAQRERLYAALKEMQARKASLMSKIEEIEAKHDAQELVGEFETIRIDTGALADAERAVAELDQRVTREARTQELRTQFLDEDMPAFDAEFELDPERDVAGEADAILGERGASNGADHEL